jgi:inner membrane transporter RhtA
VTAAPVRAAPGLERIPAVWLVVGGIVSVQFGAAIAKQLFGVVPPTAMVWLRLITSAVIFLAVVRPRLRGHSRADWAVALAFGVSLLTMNWAIYQSFARIPLGLAVTIEFLGPLAVAVVSSRRAVDFVWIVLAGGGIALLADPGGHLSASGVALAAVAAVFWGIYILLGVRVGRSWPGASGLAVAMVVGAMLSLPAGLASGRGELLDPRVLAAGLVVALACSAVPWSMEIEAMRRLPTHVFGVMMSLEPAVAALSGLVVLGERISARVAASISLVVVASVGAALGARDPEIPVDA